MPISRRKLLTSSAATLAAASTFSQSGAQSSPAKVAGPFTVRAGEGRPGGQWLVHGERAFSTKVSGSDVGKTYVAIEVHTPPGLGPALHVHPHQNELFSHFRAASGCNVVRIGRRLGWAMPSWPLPISRTPV